MKPVIRQRIGRHARPGGVVVHIVAMPTGRLIDKFDTAPGDTPLDTGDMYVELEPGERGLAMLAYDGDNGKLIHPPKPLGAVEQWVGRAVNRATGPVAWSALIINATLLAWMLATGWYSMWASMLNGACVGISVGCVLIHRRRRRIVAGQISQNFSK